MAELMPCPSCQTMLRVPPEAERIRCPQCKTEVPISKPAGAKGIPVAKPVSPLPFDRPAEPAPEPIPKARVLPPKQAIVRGRVVPDDAEENTPKKRRRPRPELDDPRYEQTDRECAIARIGVRVLAIGAGLTAAQTLLFAIFLMSLAVASTVIPALFHLALIAYALHAVCLLAGYTICIFGPKGIASISVVGIIATLAHAALLIPLMLYSLTFITKLADDDVGVTDWGITRIVFFLNSTINNLSALTDYPWMLVRGESLRGEYLYVILMTCGGLFEFAKMSVLGAIVEYYASCGKSVELGYKSLRFAYRILWVVAIIMLLKLFLYILIQQFGGDAMILQFFRIPMTLLSVAYFFWWTFSWSMQFQSMNEVVQIITPARFLDRRQVLDPN